MLGKHLSLNDQSNPSTRLTQLLQADTELMNKVGAALSGTSLFIVWRRRCRAPYQLASDVPTHSGVWKRIDDLTNTCREIYESLQKLVRRHERMLHSICNSLHCSRCRSTKFSICILQFSICNAVIDSRRRVCPHHLALHLPDPAAPARRVRLVPGLSLAPSRRGRFAIARR